MKPTKLVFVFALISLSACSLAHTKQHIMSIAEIDTWEAKREAQLNRHMSLTRRKRIYYEYWKAVNRGIAEATHGDAYEKGNIEIKLMRMRFHIPADDLDIIRTEGDRLGWPEPSINEL